MKRKILVVRQFLGKLFSLEDDKADEQSIVEGIRKDTNFRGTNLWTLIFAIFIASIGLNVNSTAVIIGAMLISPLMGPIMGIGLGIGINDFDLIKKGGKNLSIAASISIATSFLYFLLTPLQHASSELLARTTPSVWDVFIAFLGGLAGIIANTRKQKSNVIPGVAIATALMPPLCTAGFGLATGTWFYFFGALYLFFINSLFICLATFLIVKRLRFHKKEFSSPEQEKRVSRYILIIVTLTVLPSIYLAYRIVQRSIFENNAKRFVQEEFHFAKTQVVSPKYIFDGKQQSIELLLIGQPLEENLVDTLKGKMLAYNLSNTALVIHQGLDAKQKIDLSEIKASVLEEVYATNRNKDTSTQPQNITESGVPDIKNEMRALYPELQAYSLSQAVFKDMASGKDDTITLLVGHFSHPFPSKEKKKLGLWIKQRLQADSVRVIIE